jgi:hypothetical protein
VTASVRRIVTFAGLEMAARLTIPLTGLEMEDVHDDIGSAIQQDNVPANQNVRAIRRGRRQPPFQVLGTRLKSFL